MTDVAALAAQLRDSRGFAHKRDIAAVVGLLGIGGGDDIAVGDDAAAIPDGDGHLLLAIEGFVADFITADPWFAGYCGVMVNISDIAAMGGTPTAIVDAVWAEDTQRAALILRGLRDGAKRYGVPIVGGHSNLRNPGGQLAVAVLGRAERLITSFDAKPGEILIVATDLRGQFRDPFPWWDASSDTDGARLQGDLALLPLLAREKLVTAGKDISMAGVIGTALMMLESSRAGGTIDLLALPKPADVSLERWLTAFPSFGFIFATAPEHVARVVAIFGDRDIACAPVGTVDAALRFDIVANGARATVWNMHEPFIACHGAPALPELSHA